MLVSCINFCEVLRCRSAWLGETWRERFQPPSPAALKPFAIGGFGSSSCARTVPVSTFVAWEGREIHRAASLHLSDRPFQGLHLEVPCHRSSSVPGRDSHNNRSIHR